MDTVMNKVPAVGRKAPLKVRAIRLLKYLPIFILLLFFAFLLMAPLIWMCLGAFKSDPEVLSYPPRYFPPANHFLENWANVNKQIDFMHMTFNTIVYPMIKPGVGALAIFTFISSWNDYFMQLIMLSSTKNLTISLGIANMQAENTTDFGLIMAGAAFAAVPIIIVFIIFQKYFTKGITMGAVKG